MSKININDYSFENFENGNGEPLVFVHGSASDYRTWQKQQEEFSKSYRIIAYSRRYHWPNQKISDEADYSMPQHVNDLQVLIEKLNTKPVHLIGHSYGAFLCLLLAIQKPSLVRSLVLAEPPVITLFVSNSPKPDELLKLLLTRPLTAISIINFGTKGVEPAKKLAAKGETQKAMFLFGKTILGQQFFDKLSEQRREQVVSNSIRSEFLGSGFAKLDAKKVRNVQIPTLLITAQHSHRMFHNLADRLEELLPNTEHIEIKNASHIMHEDNVADYNKTVLSFLEHLK